jgi:hypothetical protein
MVRDMELEEVLPRIEQPGHVVRESPRFSTFYSSRASPPYVAGAACPKGTRSGASSTSGTLHPVLAVTQLAQAAPHLSTNARVATRRRIAVRFPKDLMLFRTPRLGGYITQTRR